MSSLVNSHIILLLEVYSLVRSLDLECLVVATIVELDFALYELLTTYSYSSSTVSCVLNIKKKQSQTLGIKGYTS